VGTAGSGADRKSLFALEWLQCPALRRRVQIGLNKGEARAVFFNRLGELRDRTYEDQRHRVSGLHVVTAAIMLWNTVYLAEAVAVCKQQGIIIDDEHLRHLSPVGWEHICLTGDYLWNFHHVPRSGHLRSLRIPIR
jgi:TnpA family transposase